MGTKRGRILQESQFVWFGALFFSQGWVDFEKHSKLSQNSHFSAFFGVCSILAEKRRTRPKKLISLMNFASFGAHVAPQLTIIVEQI